MDELAFDNNSSSPHLLSWVKFPMDVVDDTAVRLLLLCVSLSIEVDEVLATRVAELEDRRDMAANEGGTDLGRK